MLVRHALRSSIIVMIAKNTWMITVIGLCATLAPINLGVEGPATNTWMRLTTMPHYLNVKLVASYLILRKQLNSTWVTLITGQPSVFLAIANSTTTTTYAW